MNRGDVVLVPFPFQHKPGMKVRPAVVVQSDAENRRLANTIVAMITGNLDDAGQPATVLIDPQTADGSGAGLKGASLVKCYNLATMRQRRVLHVLGHLSDALIQAVNQALKAGAGVAIESLLSGVASIRSVVLTRWPAPTPRAWIERVHQPETVAELERDRRPRDWDCNRPFEHRAGPRKIMVKATE